MYYVTLILVCLHSAFHIKLVTTCLMRSSALYVCFVDCCLSFCTFSCGHCVVCSSSIYGFWLPFWYLQTLLMWPCFTVPLEGHIRQIWLYFVNSQEWTVMYMCVRCIIFPSVFFTIFWLDFETFLTVCYLFIYATINILKELGN